MDCSNQKEKNDDSNSIENKHILEGWTKFDKFELLQALKIYGTQNLEEIQSLFPSKTIEEIEVVVDYYKQKALQHPMLLEKKKDKKLINSNSKVPLAGWAKLLMDSLPFNDLQTETATALRLIAEFENIPPPSSANDVDFRQIYHALANALDGKTLPDNHTINMLLEKCIVETACISKSFIRSSSLKQVIESVDFTDKEISVFPRPTDNHELAALRHIAVQRNYNPLNISEDYLKPSLKQMP